MVAQERASNGGSRAPIADPTPLTMASLFREILNLKENTGIRLDAMDEAIRLTQQYPTLLDKAIGGFDERLNAALLGLRELLIEKIQGMATLRDEKFHAIELQFKERDVRTEQASIAVKIAVDAALQAQKEAVAEQNKSRDAAIAKSEAAVTKQIEGIQLLIASNTKAGDDKIADSKDRTAILENRIQAVESTRKGADNTWGFIVGAVGIGSAVVMGLMAFNSRQSAPAPQPIVIERTVPAPAADVVKP
jgi:hypothetical protein